MKITPGPRRDGCTGLLILMLVIGILGMLVWIFVEWLQGLTPRPEPAPGNFTPSVVQGALPAAAHLSDRMMNGTDGAPARQWFGMEFTVASNRITITRVFIPQAQAQASFAASMQSRTGLDLAALAEGQATNNGGTVTFDAAGHATVSGGARTICVERKGTLENPYEGTGQVSYEDAELMQWEPVQIMTVPVDSVHAFIDTSAYAARAFYRVRLLDP